MTAKNAEYQDAVEVIPIERLILGALHKSGGIHGKFPAVLEYLFGLIIGQFRPLIKPKKPRALFGPTHIQERIRGKREEKEGRREGKRAMRKA